MDMLNSARTSAEPAQAAPAEAAAPAQGTFHPLCVCSLFTKGDFPPTCHIQLRDARNRQLSVAAVHLLTPAGGVMGMLNSARTSAETAQAAGESRADRMLSQEQETLAQLGDQEVSRGCRCLASVGALCVF